MRTRDSKSIIMGNDSSIRYLFPQTAMLQDHRGTIQCHLVLPCLNRVTAGTDLGKAAKVSCFQEDKFTNLDSFSLSSLVTSHYKREDKLNKIKSKCAIDG